MLMLDCNIEFILRSVFSQIYLVIEETSVPVCIVCDFALLPVVVPSQTHYFVCVFDFTEKHILPVLEVINYVFTVEANGYSFRHNCSNNYLTISKGLTENERVTQVLV